MVTITLGPCFANTGLGQLTAIGGFTCGWRINNYAAAGTICGTYAEWPV